MLGSRDCKSKASFGNIVFYKCNCIPSPPQSLRPFPKKGYASEELMVFKLGISLLHKGIHPLFPVLRGKSGMEEPLFQPVALG